MANLSSCFKTALDNIPASALELLENQLDTIARTLTTPLIEEINGIEATLCALEDQAALFVQQLAQIDTILGFTDEFLGNNFCPDIEALQGCLEDIKDNVEAQLNDLPIVPLKERLLEVQTQRAEAETLTACASNMKDAIGKALS